MKEAIATSEYCRKMEVKRAAIYELGLINSFPPQPFNRVQKKIDKRAVYLRDRIKQLSTVLPVVTQP